MRLSLCARCGSRRHTTRRTRWAHSEVCVFRRERDRVLRRGQEHGRVDSPLGLGLRRICEAGDDRLPSFQPRHEILQDGGLDPYAENPIDSVAGPLAARGPLHSLDDLALAVQPCDCPDLHTPRARRAVGTLRPRARPQAPALSLDDLARLGDVPSQLCARAAGGSPEDFAEPLLGELGLLQEVHKGQYAFRRGPKASSARRRVRLCPRRLLEPRGRGPKLVGIRDVAYAEGSPGRVFKLDEESIAERLIALSDFTGRKLAWTDSAGLRQVHRKDR